MSFKCALAVAMFSTVAATASFAASPAVVRVSLTGEGGSDMHINLNQASIKAGKVVLDVTNDAMTESHELVLVKISKPDQKIPVNLTVTR